MKTKILIILFLFLVIIIFLNYNIVLDSTLLAFNVWLHKVFPFLFLMFVINDILINLNVEKLFKTTTPLVFFLALLSGAPANAFIIGKLYHQGKITETTANKYLLFTYFANPLFMYTFFRTLFNLKIALKLIIIHYLSNIIIFVFTKHQITNHSLTNTQKATFNLGASLNKSFNTLLMILGTITFFMVITNLCTNFFHFKPFFTLILKGFLEVTQGLNYLIDYPLAYKLKQIVAIAFVSFGGLSIHSQVKCLLDEFKLNYHFFLRGRIYQMLLSILLALIT